MGQLAGDEGFEPPFLGPEPSALPLGQSPVQGRIINNKYVIIHTVNIIVSSKLYSNSDINRRDNVKNSRNR